MYFHPFGGGGWPVSPPNYLGFRYKGRLQSVHHVEKYEIVKWTALPKHIPEIKYSKWDRNFIVYTLGRPIYPSEEVRSGTLRMAAHCWAMIDLLLTCKTISQARDLSKKRKLDEV
jgi:hypothetical protein